MSKNLSIFMLIAGLALALTFIGCSDDETPTSGGGGLAADTTALELLDLGELVAAVAPPEYTAPAGKAFIDSIEAWTEGDYPLLDKVFGSDDPQTLYRNIESYEDFMGQVEHFLLVDENGDFITGTFNDTVSDTVDGTPVTFTPTVTVTALTSATSVPTEAQAIIGTSVDLDYLVSLAIPEIAGGTVQYGFKIDSTEQTVLIYEADMSGGDNEESSLVYASMDPTDSTIVFKGVGYSEDDRGMFTYVFNMASETDGDFTYRMSWYSDDNTPDLLGSIIGGGDKDTEFAMTYRQFMPADTTVADPEWAFEQVFGPNYTEGTGLISSYSTYTDTTLYYNYDDVPQGDITNPFAD